MATEQKSDFVALTAFNAGFGHFDAGDPVSQDQLDQAKVKSDDLLAQGLICRASDYKQESGDDTDQSKDYPPGVPRVNVANWDATNPTPEHAKERNQGVTDKHPPRPDRVEREAQETRARPQPPKAGPTPALNVPPAPTQAATPGATSAANQPADNSASPANPLRRTA